MTFLFLFFYDITKLLKNVSTVFFFCNKNISFSNLDKTEFSIFANVFRNIDKGFVRL